MFETFALYRALSRLLRSRSTAPQPAPRAARPLPANDNRPAVRRPDAHRTGHNRIVLLCQWYPTDSGAGLACRWRPDLDTTAIEPIGSARFGLAPAAPRRARDRLA